MACTGFIEPLNLECWFVNVLSDASMDIFMFLAFIFIAAMAAYFRMMNTVTLIMFALFAILMAQFMSGVYLLVVLIGGLVSFWAIAKIVK